MTISLRELPAEDFEALLGQALQACAQSQAFSLQVEAVERSPHPTGREIPGFSVFLRSAPGASLEQGIVCLTHPAHGDLELFMTVIGRDARGTRYEIVFN
jgi:hypothetical protein